MIEDSFIKLPREEVIKLCGETILHIYAQRRKEDDAFLIRKMKWANWNPIRRLFRRPEITFEQIKKEYIDHREAFFPSCYAWVTLSNVERILLAATASHDDIYVSSSDYSLIGK